MIKGKQAGKRRHQVYPPHLHAGRKITDSGFGQGVKALNLKPETDYMIIIINEPKQIMKVLLIVDDEECQGTTGHIHVFWYIMLQAKDIHNDSYYNKSKLFIIC